MNGKYHRRVRLLFDKTALNILFIVFTSLTKSPPKMKLLPHACVHCVPNSGHEQRRRRYTTKIAIIEIVMNWFRGVIASQRSHDFATKTNGNYLAHQYIQINACYRFSFFYSGIHWQLNGCFSFKILFGCQFPIWDEPLNREGPNETETIGANHWPSSIRWYKSILFYFLNTATIDTRQVEVRRQWDDVKNKIKSESKS